MSERVLNFQYPTQKPFRKWRVQFVFRRRSFRWTLWDRYKSEKNSCKVSWVVKTRDIPFFRFHPIIQSCCFPTPNSVLPRFLDLDYLRSGLARSLGCLQNCGRWCMLQHHGAISESWVAQEEQRDWRFPILQRLSMPPEVFSHLLGKSHRFKMTTKVESVRWLRLRTRHLYIFIV